MGAAKRVWENFSVDDDPLDFPLVTRRPAQGPTSNDETSYEKPKDDVEALFGYRPPKPEDGDAGPAIPTSGASDRRMPQSPKRLTQSRSFSRDKISSITSSKSRNSSRRADYPFEGGPREPFPSNESSGTSSRSTAPLSHREPANQVSDKIGDGSEDKRFRREVSFYVPESPSAAEGSSETRGSPIKRLNTPPPGVLTHSTLRSAESALQYNAPPPKGARQRGGSLPASWSLPANGNYKGYLYRYKGKWRKKWARELFTIQHNVLLICPKENPLLVKHCIPLVNIHKIEKEADATDRRHGNRYKLSVQYLKCLRHGNSKVVSMELRCDSVEDRDEWYNRLVKAQREALSRANPLVDFVEREPVEARMEKVYGMMIRSAVGVLSGVVLGVWRRNELNLLRWALYELWSGVLRRRGEAVSNMEEVRAAELEKLRAAFSDKMEKAQKSSNNDKKIFLFCQKLENFAKYLKFFVLLKLKRNADFHAIQIYQLAAFNLMTHTAQTHAATLAAATIKFRHLRLHNLINYLTKRRLRFAFDALKGAHLAGPGESIFGAQALYGPSSMEYFGKQYNSSMLIHDRLPLSHQFLVFLLTRKHERERSQRREILHAWRSAVNIERKREDALLNIIRIDRHRTSGLLVRRWYLIALSTGLGGLAGGRRGGGGLRGLVLGSRGWSIMKILFIWRSIMTKNISYAFRVWRQSVDEDTKAELLQVSSNLVLVNRKVLETYSAQPRNNGVSIIERVWHKKRIEFLKLFFLKLKIHTEVQKNKKIFFICLFSFLVNKLYSKLKLNALHSLIYHSLRHADQRRSLLQSDQTIQPLTEQEFDIIQLRQTPFLHPSSPDQAIPLSPLAPLGNDLPPSAFNMISGTSSSHSRDTAHHTSRDTAQFPPGSQIYQDSESGRLVNADTQYSPQMAQAPPPFGRDPEVTQIFVSEEPHLPLRHQHNSPGLAAELSSEGRSVPAIFIRNASGRTLWRPEDGQVDDQVLASEAYLSSLVAQSRMSLKSRAVQILSGIIRAKVHELKRTAMFRLKTNSLLSNMANNRMEALRLAEARALTCMERFAERVANWEMRCVHRRLSHAFHQLFLNHLSCKVLISVVRLHMLLRLAHLVDRARMGRLAWSWHKLLINAQDYRKEFESRAKGARLVLMETVDRQRVPREPAPAAAPAPDSPPMDSVLSTTPRARESSPSPPRALQRMVSRKKSQREALKRPLGQPKIIRSTTLKQRSLVVKPAPTKSGMSVMKLFGLGKKKKERPEYADAPDATKDALLQAAEYLSASEKSIKASLYNETPRFLRASRPPELPRLPEGQVFKGGNILGDEEIVAASSSPFVLKNEQALEECEPQAGIWRKGEFSDNSVSSPDWSEIERILGAFCGDTPSTPTTPPFSAYDARKGYIEPGELLEIESLLNEWSLGSHQPSRRHISREDEDWILLQDFLDDAHAQVVLERQATKVHQKKKPGRKPPRSKALKEALAALAAEGYQVRPPPTYNNHIIGDQPIKNPSYGDAFVSPPEFVVATVQDAAKAGPKPTKSMATRVVVRGSGPLPPWARKKAQPNPSFVDLGGRGEVTILGGVRQAYSSGGLR